MAAGVTGAVLLLLPGLSLEMQLLVFAFAALASIAGWTAYRRRHPAVLEQPSLNRRGSQYVGRVFTLDEPIVNGQGRLRVDDTVWKIQGPDCARGARVTVAGVDSTVLQVHALAD